MQAVADELFRLEDDGPRLIGTRCRSCATVYFPCTHTCRNPGCMEKSVERVLLPDRGTLYSYTVQRYRPPPLFRMDGWAPYAIGLVDLGEGIRVMGMLSKVEPEDVVIGMPLRLVVEPLYVDDQHGAVHTFKFVPDRA